ncbi:MAG: hypothetical protein NTW16_04810, partial [Bacteroidetes bacterium]|nr:hypothetical protein [Bacteroidota bacterium]
MIINLYKPQNILLQNFIEYFYILTRQAEEEAVAYLTFPNIYSMVSISYQASIKTAGNKVTVEFDANNILETGLALRYLQPLLIEYTGVANEITICFKPLALNAFLDHPVSDYCKNDAILDKFTPFDDYNAKMKAIMIIPKDEEKIAAMETYWISKLKGVSHPFLYQALNYMLLPNNKEMTIAEIAGKI